MNTGESASKAEREAITGTTIVECWADFQHSTSPFMTHYMKMFFFRIATMQMILFEKDWQNYPTAIADFDTTNRSFVRMAALYRKMGIKNHTFMLALVNPLLKGVNPHDPNITNEQIGMVMAEIKINPWYFFREVARVPALSGSDSRPLEANRGNIALIWSFFNHVMIILIQPRQTGKSLTTDLLMTTLMRHLCTNTTINLISKDDALRRENIDRLKNILEDLPWYAQVKSRGEPNNGEELACFALGNKYKTYVPQAAVKAALKLGRGISSSINQWDEAPYQNNIEISFPAAQMAGGAANELAAKSGSPYGTILTTTAGEKDDRDGKYIYEMVSGAAVWTERFFDAADQTALYKMVRANSSNKELCINATFDHYQLGKDDAWMMKRIEDSRAKGTSANKDLFCLWSSGTVSSPFEPEVAERIAKSARGTEFDEISSIGSYILRWYIRESDIPKLKDTKLIIGLDTSNAGGGDEIGLTIVDAYTLKTVAAGNYGLTSLPVFMDYLLSLLLRFDNSILVIENKSSAQGIIDFLVLLLPDYGIDPFKRIFNRVVQEQLVDKERFKEIQIQSRRRDAGVRYKKAFGFPTSGSGQYSRDELYGNALRTAIKFAIDKINDRVLVNQILTLEKIDGRISHAVGSHDDMVISWLLCIWFLYNAVDLKYYGIDSTRIVNDQFDKMKNMSPREVVAAAKESKARARIDELVYLIGKERDEHVSIRYEFELRNLVANITLDDGEVFSVDDLLNKAREQRKIRSAQRVTSTQKRHNYGSHIFW